MSYRLCKIILNCGNCGKELQDRVLVDEDDYFMKCPHCGEHFQGIQDMYDEPKDLEDGK